MQSYMGGLANTHSSLKTASLDLDLSTTGMSGLMTGRDENIHIMPDMPDDDDDDDDDDVDDDDEVRYGGCISVVLWQ